jgi:hypothetical protein
VNKLFKTSVLAALISFGGSNAFVADDAPTVSDAHELISGMVGKNMFGNTERY